MTLAFDTWWPWGHGGPGVMVALGSWWPLHSTCIGPECLHSAHAYEIIHTYIYKLIQYYGKLNFSLVRSNSIQARGWLSEGPFNFLQMCILCIYLSLYCISMVVYVK